MESSRRIFLASGVGLAAFVSGCGSPENTQNSTVNPAVSPAIVPTPARVDSTPTRAVSTLVANLESQWSTLSPTKRIDLMETQNAPVNIDIPKEIGLAVGEIICGQMKCKITPQELAARVKIFPPEEFLTQLEQSTEPRSPEERNKEIAERVEFIGNDGNIYVNQQLFESFSLKLASRIYSEGKRNSAIVLRKSLYLHAFTHVIEADAEFLFPPFSFKIGNFGVPEMGKMVGLKFEGIDQNGLPVYLTGAHEASTELVANIIAARASQFYVNLAYSEGAGLLKEINRRAGISDDEFLRFKDGTINTESYLKKIAALRNPQNPDTKDAILALATIALGQKRLLSWQDAQVAIFSTYLASRVQPTSVVRLPSR